MHDNQNIQFFSLLPEGIELFAVIVLAVDIRGDDRAGKLKISNRTLQNLGGPRRILPGD